MARKDMNPELSAEQHFELMGDEISHDDLMVMAVWADITNGKKKQEALRAHGITEDFYDQNVERVLNT